MSKFQTRSQKIISRLLSRKGEAKTQLANVSNTLAMVVKGTKGIGPLRAKVKALTKRVNMLAQATGEVVSA